ncbi:hypothetical protein LZ32DRAFT_35639 [Colletotrichum eremochloae]|nr:hypothetical protein LZ32DRAFT_35639 [Colletotrichum eremochloae]
MVPATHGMCPPSTPGQAENMEREGQICTTNGLQGTTGLDAMPSLSLLARYAKTYTNTQQKNGTSPTQQTEHARMDNVDSCFENLIFVTWVINSFWRNGTRGLHRFLLLQYSWRWIDILMIYFVGALPSGLALDRLEPSSERGNEKIGHLMLVSGCSSVISN